MSNAHKGSRLILSGNIIPANYGSAHFNYNRDQTGIFNGNLQLDNAGNVYTLTPFEGKFGGAVWIDQGTTNTQAGPNSPSTYNNFSTSIITTFTNLTSQTGETLYGQTIWRITYQAISSNALTDMQTNIGSHGIVFNSQNYSSGNTYVASIYWRAMKSDVVVGGQAANVSGWSDIRTDKYSNGWNRTQTSMLTNVSGGVTDGKYWSFKSPSAVLNEVITIDWSCPQIEMRPWATAYTPSSRGFGKLYYPFNLLNSYSFSISLWFMIPYMHQSNTPYYGVSNSGIQGAWYNPIIELAPTSGTNAWNGIGLLAGPVSYNRQPLIYMNGNYYQSGSTPINDNTWYHGMMTYDGVNLKLYINGVLIYTEAWSTFDNSNSYVLMVGGGYMGAPNILISDLMIDNYARLAEDAMAIYTSNRPLFNPFDKRSYAL